MRLTILGGGISGLLAAYAFKKKAQITLLEASPNLGGNFTAGGLKYVRRTPEFEAMLRGFGIDFEVKLPFGGLKWGSHFHPHPQWLNDLPTETKRTIQEMHWIKTRGSLEGFRFTCMNDPAGEAGAESLDFDHNELILALEESVSQSGDDVRTGCKVTGIQDNRIGYSRDGLYGSTEADHIVTTLPMSLMSKLAPWANLPTPDFKKVTIGFFKALPDSWVKQGAEFFDYIYLPEHLAVHRVSRTPEGWQSESPGHVTEASTIESSLGVQLTGIKSIPGHLIPLAEQPLWPEHITPLGRFAEWDTRSTSEKVLARAMGLSRRLHREHLRSET